MDGGGYNFDYQPDGDVIAAFHNSDAFFRGIRGPIGSGKSTCCAVEIMLRGMRQDPGRDGVRRTKWAIIRNTTPQLKTTTLQTWLEWFPEEVFGKVKYDPPISHVLRFGDVEIEAIFLGLDNEKDLRKLLSLELTGAWLNEAREMPKATLDMTTSRVGRYPSPRGGVHPTWSGVIADTNSPGPVHWWGIMSGEVPPPDFLNADDIASMVLPDSWEFFTQPAAMIAKKDATGLITGYEINEERENRYIRPDYYTNMLPGKSADWINVYIRNNFGDVFTGRPVYPSFNEAVHVARQPIPVFKGEPIYVGMDFGLTPAAVFGQRVRGRWFVLRELVSYNSGTLKFADAFKRFVAEEFRGEHEFIITGDPAGDQRAQTDEKTPFDILHAENINAHGASTNDIGIRIDMVDHQMRTMTDGNPNYLIDPRCKTLIAGKKGGYHYATVRGAQGEHKDTPNKNEYSHVSDAEQYMMDGGGESRRLTSNSQTRGQSKARVKINPMTTSPFKRPPNALGKLR